MIRALVCIGCLVGAFCLLGWRWYETTREVPGRVRAIGALPSDYAPAASGSALVLDDVAPKVLPTIEAKLAAVRAECTRGTTSVLDEGPYKLVSCWEYNRTTPGIEGTERWTRSVYVGP